MLGFMRVWVLFKRSFEKCMLMRGHSLKENEQMPKANFELSVASTYSSIRVDRNSGTRKSAPGYARKLPGKSNLGTRAALEF